VKLFNAGVTALFDLLFWPFARLSPLWGLAVFSVLTGILMLWIFGLVSNQDAIRTIRDRIRGNLIAVRLFGDDLGLLFRLQGRLLRDNVVFLKYALVPLLVMIVPVLLILVQLNLRYGASPLEPGQSALVKVTLRDAAAIDRGVSLEAPDGVTVETQGVRVAPLREVAWRIRPQAPGRYRLLVRVGDDPVEKELRVGEEWGAISARRTGKNLIDALLYPGEPPIRSGAVESVEVQYGALELGLFGWSINWLVCFFILSILSGFAFRKVLGVEI
jgi:uncharacterized membrane protein (DUF106 family)